MTTVEVLAGIASFLLAWTAIYFGLRRAKIRGLSVYPFLLIYRVGYSRPAASGASARWRAARLYGVISLPLMVFSIGYFFYIAGTLFFERYIEQAPGAAQQGFVPIIPGITVSLQTFLYILIAIGVAVIVHELSHAVVARAEGIPVKDAGFLLLAFVPAAFVEPDEESMKAARRSSRIKVYAAGVAANLALGLAFMYLLAALLPSMANGVLVVGVQNGSPAYVYGLRPGMMITAINGTPVRTLSQALEELVKVGAESNASAVIGLTVTYKGAVSHLIIRKWAGVSHLGIDVEQSYAYPSLAGIMIAMEIVNLGLALVNAAPFAFPLPDLGVETDGGQALREAMTALGKGWENAAKAVEVITLIVLLSLLSLTRLVLP